MENIVPFVLADPQVVAHILWAARLGGVAAGAPRDPAAAPPPNPSRGAARDLLLHHHRLAQLAAGKVGLLANAGAYHRVHHRSQAARRRPQVGTAPLLGHTRARQVIYSSFTTERTKCTN
jgi:hypothetical protein